MCKSEILCRKVKVSLNNCFRWFSSLISFDDDEGGSRWSRAILSLDWYNSNLGSSSPSTATSTILQPHNNHIQISEHISYLWKSVGKFSPTSQPTTTTTTTWQTLDVIAKPRTNINRRKQKQPSCHHHHEIPTRPSVVSYRLMLRCVYVVIVCDREHHFWITISVTSVWCFCVSATFHFASWLMLLHTVFFFFSSSSVCPSVSVLTC